jgi:hypothetical protein
VLLGPSWCSRALCGCVGEAAGDVGVPPVVEVGRDVTWGEDLSWYALFSDYRGSEDGRFSTQEGVCALGTEGEAGLLFKIDDASRLRVDGFWRRLFRNVVVQEVGAGRGCPVSILCGVGKKPRL